MIDFVAPVSEPHRPWTEEEHRAWDVLVDRAYRELRIRMRKFDVKLDHNSFLSGSDVVLVWRLPAAAEKDRTQAGIIIPETARESRQPHALGVYVWAGPEGTDIMAESGYLPGDIVKFARYAGDEEGTEGITSAIQAAASGAVDEAAKMVDVGQDALAVPKVLQLRANEINGSVDLTARVTGEKPVMRLVREYDPKGGTLHRYRPIPANIPGI